MALNNLPINILGSVHPDIAKNTGPGTDRRLDDAIAQINRNFDDIAAENQTKTVSQNGGTALQWGRLKNGTYGIVLSDPNNVPRILIGFHKNGQPIIAVTKTKNVFEALGE